MGRFSKNNLYRGVGYLKRNGISKSVYKALERLQRDDDEKEYDSYMRSVMATEDELNRQRKVLFENPYKISILVPVYETDPELLMQTLESVAKQSYGNWELCIADASARNDRRKTVRAFCEKWNLQCTDAFGDIYDKVKYEHLEKNLGISGNTNEALKMAHGDYIALLDHDDLLEPDALYMFMEAVRAQETTLVDGNVNLEKVYIAYTDEDKIDENNTRYFDYHKKPEFDEILLCTNNYICHLLFVDINIAKGVGGFKSDYDGAQDHDFVLRCSEGINKKQIIHIPKVLYHWRSTVNSTAENPNAKLYAYESGRRAVADHLRRKGIVATVENTAHLGFYRLSYEDYHKSVYEVSYEDYCKTTKAFISTVSQEYIMVLSDELKCLDADYLKKMVSCMRFEDIGAVTGKIIAKSGRIESAGYDKIHDNEIVPRFEGLNRHFSGYMHKADIAQTVGAFSYECVLLRKSALDIEESKDTINVKLKPGFGVYYAPELVFKRRKV